MTIEIDDSKVLDMISNAEDDDIIFAMTESEISDNAKRKIVEAWIKELPPFQLRQIEVALKEELPG